MNLLQGVECEEERGWVKRHTEGVSSQVTERSDWGRLLNLSENWVLHLYEGETWGCWENALDFTIFPLLSYVQNYLPQGLVF